MAWLQGLPAAAVAAILAAYLTSLFGLKRFRHEKVLERKMAAYAEVFGALHTMRRWFLAHSDVYFQIRNLDENEERELAKDYKEAKAALGLQVASTSWLMPRSCQDILANLDKELRDKHDNWFIFLDTGGFAVIKTMEDLVIMVRQDLGLDTPAYQRPIVQAKAIANRLVNSLWPR